MMISVYTIGWCALALSLIYLYYCNFGVNIRSMISKRFTKSVPLQFAVVYNEHGEVVQVCGYIRPGEWQCNCKDQTTCSERGTAGKPHRGVLVRKGAEAQPKPEITDRRGLIAAQKARKRSGR
jgi:hypothetical protein